MKEKMNPVISSDILRYKKNKFGANLALMGLAAGCLYFLVLYAQVKNGDFYYTWQIAFDVIYNLFFLLAVFLFSEQVKNYDRSLFYVQLCVGALQIARIFWLPLTGILAEAISAGVFVAMLIFLALSGVLIICSAVIGFIRSKEVENFNKKVDSGEVDIDKTLKELDEEDERRASNIVAEQSVTTKEIKLVEEEKHA